MCTSGSYVPNQTLIFSINILRSPDFEILLLAASIPECEVGAVSGLLFHKNPQTTNNRKLISFKFC